MLPEIVEKTMNRLCEALEARTSSVESVYLYGSVALNDYIEGTSDIDFVAIVRKPLTQLEIQSIMAAHEEVERELPNADIMGAYILLEDVGKKPNEMNTFVAYFNKRLHTDGSGADINPITWWILKKHGIRIYGSAVAFHYEIDLASLLAYVKGNLNSYWVNWIDRLEKQLSFDNVLEDVTYIEQLDKAIEWCTLGMLRQWYTLKERDITSKIGAGNYGIQQLPEKWHGLIQEAIAIKRLEPSRYYLSQKERLTDLVALLQYIHLDANR
ncbi:hypothetical protein BC351_22160 [Paenibacillus ferrarius]|uniref:Adenylyltransferase AadA C-terminal domain-containing protein n=1 Tax=Paenibacillus ferrarius TaxID=1469647 RepID=A0A1V4HMW5_9BACL|nr:nucleotidyltransferase domain-containing protein [Paenibacillus ferrarius]OPH59034.1 hypothetical protein BC351_22160 [Paenibacillus ferrarius]